MARILLTLTLLLAVRSALACGGKFSAALLTKDQIEAEFSDAIFQLEVAGAEPDTFTHLGTAYLIDASHGYTITAGHNIVKAAGQPLFARSTARPRERLSVSVVAVTCEPADNECLGDDVALVQVQEMSRLGRVRPLDIIMEEIDDRPKIYVLGYGAVAANLPPVLNTRPGDVTAIYPRLVALQVTGEHADSGSPVVDEFGRVIATVVQRAKSGVMVAQPITVARELLERVPPTPRVLQLDERLRRVSSERIDTTWDEDLRRALRSHSAGCTNLELLSWAVLIGSRPHEYAHVQHLIRCPLTRAFDHRNLHVATKYLDGVASHASVGRALYREGLSELQLNNTENAALALERAASDLVIALREWARDHPEGLTYALCRTKAYDVSAGEATLRIGRESITSRLLPCEQGKPDTVLYYLLKDLALTRLAAARAFGDEVADQQALLDAVAAARVATWAGPERIRAAAYTDLAAALTALGYYAKAAASLAVAHDLNAPVEAKWKEAADTAVGRGELSPADRDGGIRKAPRLHLNEFREYVVLTSSGTPSVAPTTP